MTSSYQSNKEEERRTMPYTVDVQHDDHDLHHGPSFTEQRRESDTTAVTTLHESSNVDVEKQVKQTSNEEDINRVKWQTNDRENPKNWSNSYRAFCTFQLGILAFSASMASSIISPSSQVLAEKFNLSENIMVFAVSLYVLGFAFGPCIFSGISETLGRRWSLLPAMFGLAIFSIGSAVSNSPEALFITRFFGGIFGSAPVSNVAACLGDMYDPKTRGVAVSLYALAVVAGPVIAPLIGAALTLKVSWRWTEYLTAIWAFAVTIFTCFFLPETYEPVLLKKRAIKLRKETGNEKLYHPHESVKLDPKSILTKQITRPVRMLFTEPIVTVIALYASFIYALLYMSLEIVPLIFTNLRGWGPVVSTLPFLAIFVGILAALAINLGNAPFYSKAVDKAGGKPVPEARLPPMFLGTIFFCVGLFWIGWTADPKYSWVLPVFGLGFLGAGFNSSFQQCINFLVDSYTLYAASAVAANTFLRSLMAAGLPFAVRPMFEALGAAKALSILGALAGAAIPMPVLFRIFGKKLRAKSKFAQE
ncbi:hypothetical protein L7F22_043803 [Adiantum nelumboides]|nr:hypothetical protein [Adiantum nelumboides]